MLTRDNEAPHEKADRRPLHQEIGEGLRWVFGNSLLRRIVATTGVSNLFSTISFTLLPLFILRDLELSPALMGLIFSLAAVGGLAGAAATPHIVKRIGEARAIPVGSIGFSVIALFIPVAAMIPAFAFPLLVVQGFFASFAVLLYNITQVTFRQRITPSRLLGRMNASIRFCVWGVMPIGALAAGVLGTWLGVVPTLWIAAVGQLLSVLFVVIGPFWAMRELPDVHAGNDADVAATEAVAATKINTLSKTVNQKYLAKLSFCVLCRKMCWATMPPGHPPTMPRRCNCSSGTRLVPLMAAILSW